MRGRSWVRGSASILLITSRVGLFAACAWSSALRVAESMAGLPASMRNSAASASFSVCRACCTIRAFRPPRAECKPGVSSRATWAPGRETTPRMRERVVCGLGETMASFWPSSRLSSVLFPTFGRPTMAAKPARCGPGGAACGNSGRLLAAHDLHVLQRHLAVPGTGDLGDQLEPLHHLAEDGVAVVEVRRRDLGDEELRAVGVRPRVRHREQARLVEAAAALELDLEAVAGIAGAGAQRVAVLDHEVGDAKVED